MMPSPHPPPPQAQQPSPAPDGNTPQPVPQNGATIPGKHLAPIAPASISNGTPLLEGGSEKNLASTIEEGKQKAKAVVAASGLSLPSAKNGKVSPERSIAPPTSEVKTNGLNQSRKRSRSGSRIPQTIRRPDAPVRTKDIANKVLLEQYVTHDLVHSAAMIVDKFDQNRLIKFKVEETDMYRKLGRERQTNPAAIFGHGYAGYGNGDTNVQGRVSKVVYPVHRKRPAGRKTRELHISRKEAASQAEQLDELVPIRLDIEWDKIRLRDTFTWNVHDRVIPPELFAEQLVEDFKLPLDQCGLLVQQVSSALKDQVQDFHPPVFIDEDALDPHLPYHAYKNDEMRITIKLNITIGQHTLIDQFEWEINNPMNVAEDFARQMSRDLSLSGEFTTAIAHSIREQSQLFTRSLYVTGHPFDGRPVEDQELKASFLPSPLTSTFRPYQAAKDFTPVLYELNEIELEKTELSLSREERRQKRSVNRRGGPALPDLKDRRRTIRTLVVSSVLPGAAESIEDSRLFKRAATASGKARRPGLGQKDGIDDSDESDSGDSSPDSPAIPSYLLAGTARTRGMRGAATAAQASMRANFGRSLTPETSSLHHHETRTSGRRIGGKEYREESVDSSPSLIIKLPVSWERYHQFIRDRRAKSKGDSLQPQARSSSRRSPSADPSMGTPAPGSMGPPATTPHSNQQNTPGQQLNGSSKQQSPGGGQELRQQQNSASQYGRVDALGPNGPDFPTVSQRLFSCPFTIPIPMFFHQLQTLIIILFCS